MTLGSQHVNFPGDTPTAKTLFLIRPFEVKKTHKNQNGCTVVMAVAFNWMVQEIYREYERVWKASFSSFFWRSLKIRKVIDFWWLLKVTTLPCLKWKTCAEVEPKFHHLSKASCFNRCSNWWLRLVVYLPETLSLQGNYHFDDLTTYIPSFEPPRNGELLEIFNILGKMHPFFRGWMMSCFTNWSCFFKGGLPRWFLEMKSKASVLCKGISAGLSWKWAMNWKVLWYDITANMDEIAQRQ